MAFWYKKRILAVLLLLLEIISFVLDKIGGSNRLFLVASFLLSAIGFVTTIYTSFFSSTVPVTRSESERQLIAVEIVFSFILLVFTYIQLIRVFLGAKSNNSESLLPIAFAVISVVFIFRNNEDERRAKAQLEEDERLAKAQLEEDERLAKAQLEEDERRAKAQLEEDEQLAKSLQESLSVDSPPRYDNASSFQPLLSSYRTCAGCNTEIGHGRYLSCMGATWHPECFRCQACNQPITDFEFSLSGNRSYHKHCYKECHHPRCDVCHDFIPINSAGLIEYRAHPFWLQKYCPSHERDGTPRCCSCERMESRDTMYLSLDDGRKLCLECLDSAIMDTHECQPLYLEIQQFYEGINMKVEQQVPLLLVERSALNEAMEGEKNGHHHLPETRGLCLSEEQTITTVSRRPKIGAGYRFIDMITEPRRLIRCCEVTSILILFGLPRLLTGSILAHEMMHAWLRLKGYLNLRPEVEEGICQVMAHMWLDSEMYSGSGSDAASSSSSFSSSTTSSKKGKRSDFEKELGKFFKHQIEADTSSAYGDGFREGIKAVNQFGLRRTLDHIGLTGCFP